jgi:hypothetical protein
MAEKTENAEGEKSENTMPRPTRSFLEDLSLIFSRQWYVKSII